MSRRRQRVIGENKLIETLFVEYTSHLSVPTVCNKKLILLIIYYRFIKVQPGASLDYKSLYKL